MLALGHSPITQLIQNLSVCHCIQEGCPVRHFLAVRCEEKSPGFVR